MGSCGKEDLGITKWRFRRGGRGGVGWCCFFFGKLVSLE